MGKVPGLAGAPTLMIQAEGLMPQAEGSRTRRARKGDGPPAGQAAPSEP